MIDEPNFIPRTPLPAWVNWLAQDANGVWWGYEVEPLQHHQGWYENELGRCIKVAEEPVNPDWKNSLQRYSARGKNA